MTDVEAVILDLDGVLCDAQAIHREALTIALSEIGRTLSTEETQRLEGRPTRVKLAMLGYSSYVAAEVEARKQTETARLIEGLSPCPDRVALLRQLRAIGTRTACVTNSIRASAVPMLERSGLLPFLDLIVAGDEAAAPKPDPSGYLTAVRALGCERALGVEDTEIGAQAVTAAGLELVVVDFASMVGRVRARLELVEENHRTDSAQTH
jgi:HAD superfamily hydrolase (TIGR01509 family)